MTRMDNRLCLVFNILPEGVEGSYSTEGSLIGHRLECDII